MVDMSREAMAQMSTVFDRAVEDKLSETGQMSAIEIYPPEGDDYFDMVSEAADEAGVSLFRETFAPQRKAMREMVNKSIMEARAAGLGDADMVDTPIDVSDDEIDDLVMMSLHPDFAKQESVMPTPPDNVPPIDKTIEGGDK